MAHIPDGLLSAPVLVAGGLVSAALLAAALPRLREEALPQAAVLAAAFFVASLISIPLGPSSVHLLLNGLMGLVLGWAAVPAIVVALGLQAVFFGYGGLLVLGVNSMNLALPALCCAMLLGPLLRRTVAGAAQTQSVPGLQPSRRAFLVGLAAGAIAVMLTGVMIAGSLIFSGEAFEPAAHLVLATFVPLALIEGLLTGTVVAFLFRVEPSLLVLAGESDV
jgi:cobalt/nickel transport system permease protein